MRPAGAARSPSSTTRSATSTCASARSSASAASGARGRRPTPRRAAAWRAGRPSAPRRASAGSAAPQVVPPVDGRRAAHGRHPHAAPRVTRAAQRTGWEGADRWFAPSARSDARRPARDAAGPRARCAVCGAELEPDQTYCLECGSPTPLAPRLRRGPRRPTCWPAPWWCSAWARAPWPTRWSTTTTTAAAGSTAPTVDDDRAHGHDAGRPAAARDRRPRPARCRRTRPSPTPTDTTGAAPRPAPAASTRSRARRRPPPPPSPDTPTDHRRRRPVEPTDPSSSGDWPAGETAWTAILSSLGNESTRDRRQVEARGPGRAGRRPVLVGLPGPAAGLLGASSRGPTPRATRRSTRPPSCAPVPRRLRARDQRLTLVPMRVRSPAHDEHHPPRRPGHPQLRPAPRASARSRARRRPERARASTTSRAPDRAEGRADHAPPRPRRSERSPRRAT